MAGRGIGRGRGLPISDTRTPGDQIASLPDVLASGRGRGRGRGLPLPEGSESSHDRSPSPVHQQVAIAHTQAAPANEMGAQPDLDLANVRQQAQAGQVLGQFADFDPGRGRARGRGVTLSRISLDDRSSHVPGLRPPTPPATAHLQELVNAATAAAAPEEVGIVEIDNLAVQQDVQEAEPSVIAPLPENKEVPPAAERGWNIAPIVARQPEDAEKEKVEEVEAAKRTPPAGSADAQPSGGRRHPEENPFVSITPSSAASAPAQPRPATGSREPRALSPSSARNDPPQHVQLMHSERTDKPAETRRGTEGTRTPLITNFLRLSIAPGKGLFEYHVNFKPEVDAISVRKRVIHLLSERHDLHSQKTFDGMKLVLPVRMENDVTTFTIQHPFNTGETVEVTTQFARRMALDAAVQFYNILLRRAMEMIGMHKINKAHFDGDVQIDLPAQHQLEIWRGYETAADYYEGGLMVCISTCHRVLARTTVLQYLNGLRTRHGVNWMEEFRNSLILRTVLTRYRNTFYRIHDIDFKSNPTSVFELRSGQRISFADYYQKEYGQTVFDRNQPLLVSRVKVSKMNPMGIGPPILLVPELCYMTGLTDEIRGNFTIMKDLIQKTRITPIERMDHVRRFAMRMAASPEATEMLEAWGLRIEMTPVEVDGQVIRPPHIRFNLNQRIRKLAPPDNEFSRTTISGNCFRPVALGRWVLLASQRDTNAARAFIEAYKSVTPALGIGYTPPVIQTVPGSMMTANEIRKHIKQHIRKDETQFVVIIMPQSRDDPYAAAKQELLVSNAIPSQVILSKTLNNQKKVRSIVQKIALQINCKLGGAIWALEVPNTVRLMFIGVDTYHDPKKKDKSVMAMVASMDNECTRFRSKMVMQTSHQEIGLSIGPLFADMLAAYFGHNRAYPTRIIVFRDGISDGQHDDVRKNEIPPCKAALEKNLEDLEVAPKEKPKFAFIITQKRINERLFVKKVQGLDNPVPGTIVDHTATRRGEYDFFLVSQSVRQGAVTPTHYYVLEDGQENKPDLIQKFTFYLTYMYFNWPGSIRVPAVCQYAHKLAYLVGQHLKERPMQENESKLFYL